VNSDEITLMLLLRLANELLYTGLIALNFTAFDSYLSSDDPPPSLEEFKILGLAFLILIRFDFYKLF